MEMTTEIIMEIGDPMEIRGRDVHPLTIACASIAVGTCYYLQVVIAT